MNKKATNNKLCVCVCTVDKVDTRTFSILIV